VGSDDIGSQDGARFAGTWTAGQVARHLGVAESTLRSWHRRYGLGPHARPAGRHRRYRAKDVARLERMRDLIAAGTSPADAAREVRRVAGERVEMADLLGGLVAAAGRLDSPGCLALLRRGLSATDTATVWERLCRPALRAIEQDQAELGRCPDAEHVLSWAISTVLGGVAHAGLGRPAGRRPCVLLACVAGERHTLPLEALAAVLAERGFEVRVLGADTPTEAIVNAVAVSRPAAVVAWSQRPGPYEAGEEDPVRAEVAEAARAWRASLVTAGPGWRRGGSVGSLADAVETLAALTGRAER
jgi:DNA-binding transcriptional MerR regulator